MSACSNCRTLSFKEKLTLVVLFSSNMYLLLIMPEKDFTYKMQTEIPDFSGTSHVLQDIAVAYKPTHIMLQRKNI